jgi:ankyrin repeat protein
VEAGADVNSEDESGFTPLVTASGEGQFFVTDFLLRMGALPQLKARAIGGNALHLACAWGHRDIVVMLVEQSKVDLILADDAGLTPLDHAKLGGFQSIVDYLQGRVQK